MAKRKVSEQEQVIAEEVSGFSVKSIWEQYQQYILYAAGGLLVLILGWVLYKKLIVEPRQKEAIESVWQAELQFSRDSFQMALDNPGGNYDGFVAIADKYSGTAYGNLANYYAGVCYLHLGDFDNALNYLSDFNAPNDIMKAVKNGCLGDVYAEKQDYDKALSYYEDAVEACDNDLVAGYYLKKLGMFHEFQGNPEKAQNAYKKLLRDFPNQASNDWREIEKYIYKAGIPK
jgi:tetratricopeptide (TPR) repeat protein